MTINLLEFLKVFIIVFGVAGGITFFRKSFIEDLKSQADENDSESDFFTKNVMDYDGMGNFGRFPIKIKTKSNKKR
jgi:hypothetical protein